MPSQYQVRGTIAIDLLVSAVGVPPVADFTGTPTSGSDPLSVSFTDASTNSPTSWLWEKSSDGGATWATFSTAQNPAAVSFAAGTYDIRLTATNAAGSDTKTRTAYIVASAPAVQPVSFWRYDGSLADAKGVTAAPTPSGGSPTYVTGLIGQAMQGSVSMTAAATLGGSLAGKHLSDQPVSLSLWFKAPASVNNSTFGSNAGIGGNALLFGRSGSAAPYTLTAGLAGVNKTYAGKLALGWNHVVFAVDNVAKTCDVYCNGVLLETASLASQDLTAYSAGSLYLYAGNGSDAEVYDLVGIYAAKLSQSDVTALYNAGAGFDPTA